MYIERIKTVNIKNEIRNRIMPYVYKLTSLSFIEGVVLLGGISNTPSRNFMDKFSDVDMSIFIEGSRKNFVFWNELPDFEFHIPFGSRMLEVNVHQQFVDDEYANVWNEDKKEAYAYTCEIIYDKYGKVFDLISEKTKFDEEYRKKRLSIILSQYLWLVNINPLRQIERGYKFNAMDLLNTGVDLFIEGLYLYNRRYRPHPKWRMEVVRDLEWVPENFETLITNSFLIECMTSKAIKKRRDALSNLFAQLEKKILKENIFNSYSAYEFACRYAYEDRQISINDKLQRIFKSNQIDKFNLSFNECILLHGLLNEYMISSYDTLLQIDSSGLPTEYTNLLEKIRCSIK